MRLLTAALCLGLAAPAAALDLTAMTGAERAAFGQAVRDYLLENPEVLMEAIGVLEQKREADQVTSDLKILRDNAAEIYTSPADWVGGNPEGDVTVVEFLDYRCGYCRRAWEEVEQLVETDGNIRLVFKEFPILGEDSLASSQFAIAVRKLGGDATYKRAHDALISLKGPADAGALADLAEDLGLDPQKVAAEMASDETARILRANHELAMLLQINGTPTFVVNETLVRGYVPLNGMQQIVAGQRAKAD